MMPEKLNFLNEYDNFYQGLVRDVKENKYNERDFYLIMAAKTKSMDRERRGKLVLLNKVSEKVK